MMRPHVESDSHFKYPDTHDYPHSNKEPVGSLFTIEEDIIERINVYCGVGVSAVVDDS